MLLVTFPFFLQIILYIFRIRRIMITIRAGAKAHKHGKDTGMTVNYDRYVADKKAFLNRHPDWKVDTSSMDEYGRYYKNYICDDGAIFTEEMYPTYETGEAEIRGVKVKVEVPMMRIEYYSTDDANSNYYYERW